MKILDKTNKFYKRLHTLSDYSILKKIVEKLTEFFIKFIKIFKKSTEFLDQII